MCRAACRMSVPESYADAMAWGPHPRAVAGVSGGSARGLDRSWSLGRGGAIAVDRLARESSRVSGTEVGTGPARRRRSTARRRRAVIRRPDGRRCGRGRGSCRRTPTRCRCARRSGPIRLHVGKERQTLTFTDTYVGHTINGASGGPGGPTSKIEHEFVQDAGHRAEAMNIALIGDGQTSTDQPLQRFGNDQRLSAGKWS